MELGKQVRRFRDEKNMTPLDMCRLMDVDRPTLALIEGCKRPMKMKEYMRFKEILGVGLDDVEMDGESVIRISGNFIRGQDGVWYNLKSTSSLTVGGVDSKSFIQIEIGVRAFILWEEEISRDEMQEKLDGVIRLVEYENRL